MCHTVFRKKPPSFHEQTLETSQSRCFGGRVFVAQRGLAHTDWIFGGAERPDDTHLASLSRDRRPRGCCRLGGGSHSSEWSRHRRPLLERFGRTGSKTTP